MAGSNSTAVAEVASGAPSVILVEPQLGENIGMAARAMRNCGLWDLRLVRPRDGWPNARAVAAASGADAVLDHARLFDSAAEAVADLNIVYAATARPRDMTCLQMTPRQAALELRRAAAGSDGGKCRAGILFGREAKGLMNDEVALADGIVMVPLNPGFVSLNLAQAVLLIGYEWFLAGDDTAAHQVMMPKETRPATKAELIGLFEHLESELDDCGFLRVVEKRPVMVRNLRNIFQRAGLSEQEIRALRGVISGLSAGRGKR